MPLQKYEDFLELFVKRLMDYCLSIHIIVLLMQLWVSHVIVTYTNNTSRMFPRSLV